jgi:hypothetical protein
MEITYILVLIAVAIGAYFIFNRKKDAVVIAELDGAAIKSKQASVQGFSPSLSLTAEASCSFMPDGTIYTTNKYIGTENGVPARWSISIPSSDHWIKATVVSGVGVSDSGQWLKLDQTRTWGYTVTSTSPNYQEGMVKFEVAQNEDGSKIIFEKEIYMKAYR